MTEAQINTLIIANMATQITQLTAIYNAINSGTAQQISDARAALVKTKALADVLWEGKAAILARDQLQIELGTP